ncbi:hypothetical protein ROS1_02680 [Roseibium sp. ROS1]
MADTDTSANAGKPGVSSSTETAAKSNGGSEPSPARMEAQAGDPYRPAGGNDYSLSMEPEDTGEATLANLYQAVPLEDRGSDASTQDAEGLGGDGGRDGQGAHGGLGQGLGGAGTGDTLLPDGGTEVAETADGGPNDDGGLGDGAVPEARGLDPTLSQFDLGGDGIQSSGSQVGDGTSGGGGGAGEGGDGGNTEVGPVEDVDSTDNFVTENAAGGTVVGVVAFANDPDATDTVTYSITDSRFDIDPDTGLITVADGAVIDRETTPYIDIEVTATSTDGSTSTGTFRITVGDENEFDIGPVTDVDGADNFVQENSVGGTVVGVTAFAEDLDATDTVTYSITDSRFDIDPDTGVITVADGAVIDRETTPFIDIEVTATSTDGSTSTGTFRVTVGDENEFDIGPVTDVDGADNFVQENSAGGTVVGVTAFAEDPDATDTVTYSITDSRFEIDPDTGVITVADGAVIDRETTPFIDIEVTATSTDGSTSTGIFRITVGDENEFDIGPVTDVDGADNFVQENSAGGTVVGVTAFAEDPDATDTVTYSITDGRFDIDPDTGVITVADGAVIDRETTPYIDIEVTATSTDGSTSTGTFRITVGDENEFDIGPVTDVDGADNFVQENSAGGTVVGVTAFAEDPDATDTVTYSITDGRFDIDPDTGVISVADGAVIDRETTPFIDIEVTATSTDGSTSTGTFRITVGDENEFDIGPVTDVDGADNFVQENSAGGTVVGVTAFAEDPDATDTVTYSITDSRFEIDPDTGLITVADGAVIDRETTPFIDIEVTATSTDGSTSTGTFRITVGDANEFDIGPVTDVDGADNFVQENSAGGTVVGVTAFAEDPDAADTVSYSITDSRFDIDPDTGVITVADGAVIDRETTPYIDIEVTATSTDGSTSTGTFRIIVGDENEFDIGPVSDIDPAANSISETANGGEYAGITAFAEDPDPADSVSYQLTGDDRFEIDPDTGVITVKDGAQFDAEIEPSIEMTVTATSTDGSSSTKTFTVAVTDNNEAPDLIVHLENGSEQFVVNGSFEIYDGVHGGPAGSGWYENPTSIEGWTYDNVDVHEAGHNSYGATDGGHHLDLAAMNNGWASQQIEGQLDGQVYHLTFDMKSRGGVGESVAEVYWNGELIDTIDPATTGTGWQAYAYDIVGGSGDGSNTLTFVEIGSDNLGGALIDSVSIVSDNRTAVVEEYYGAEIAPLSVFDPDVGDTHTFTVSDDRFEVVVSGDRYLLKLKDDQAFDYETETQVTLEVTATDQGGLSDTEIVVIDVIDIDDTNSPIGPLADIDASANQVLENAAAGAVVGLTAFANDPDAGDSVSYQLSGDTRFEIDPVSGVITVASGASFDKETEPEIDILVTATSTDGSVSTETFTIAIADANEAPDLDFDPELGPGVSVTLTFVEEYAGHSNVLGVFYVDGNGNPMAGEIVWVNQNQLTPGDTATLYLEGVEASEIGYFLIPDGADTNNGLLAGDKVTFQKDGQGNWQAVGPDGTLLVGAEANVLFSGNGSLNPDGYDYTVESGIRIGFEDIAGGGDEDFDDVVFDQTTFETTARAAVYEEDPGAEIGTLSVFDPDVGDTHSFTVSDSRFEVISINGENILKLKDGVALDYETETQVSVEITVTDSGGLSDTETIVIDVIDVEPEGPADDNEPIGPVRDVDTAQNLVAATAAAGMVIGLTAFAEDADAGDTVTYSIDDSRFDIDADTGVVTLASGAALVAGETIDVTITATSSDGSQSSAVFPVTVTSGVTENAPPDLIVGNAIYRPDQGNKHWDDHHDGHWGHIQDGETGHYHEDDGVHGQTYHGHDDDCTGNEYHVPENQTGVELIELSVVDPDIGDTHTFTVSDDRFEVVSNGDSYLLKLKDDAAVDYETEQSITIDVTATDSGGLSDTETITLDVVDFDDVPLCEVGTSNADTIVGGDFVDSISGLGGNDILLGQGGNDLIYGGAGDDVIRGGAGDDVLSGGDGSDLFAYMLGDGHDSIYGGAGGSWIDIVDLSKAADGTDIGTYGVDWSITMTEGSIESIDAAAGEITLSQDSGGYIEFADGGRIDFTDLEGVQY